MELLSLTFHLFFIFLSCQLQTLSAEIFLEFTFRNGSATLMTLIKAERFEIWQTVCVKAWLDWRCSQGVFITQNWRVRSACLPHRYFLGTEVGSWEVPRRYSCVYMKIYIPSYLPSPTDRKSEHAELRYHLKTSEQQKTTYAVTHLRNLGKNGGVEEVQIIFIREDEDRWFIG